MATGKFLTRSSLLRESQLLAEVQNSNAHYLNRHISIIFKESVLTRHPLVPLPRSVLIILLRPRSAGAARGDLLLQT